MRIWLRKKVKSKLWDTILTRLWHLLWSLKLFKQMRLFSKDQLKTIIIINNHLKREIVLHSLNHLMNIAHTLLPPKQIHQEMIWLMIQANGCQLETNKIIKVYKMHSKEVPLYSNQIKIELAEQTWLLAPYHLVFHRQNDLCSNRIILIHQKLVIHLMVALLSNQLIHPIIIIIKKQRRHLLL